MSGTVFRLRSALSGPRRRTLHALRHTLPATAPPRGDVFNLDLHVAVVGDIRGVLEERGLSLTSWTLSGHAWLLGREPDPVAVVTESTWFDLDARRVKRFQRVYGRYLRPFPGFVATYPPAFALLYEEFPGPTLAVAATRYEWPFTRDAARWAWLDESLRAGVEGGTLTLVANNRADADYLANYTGLRPPAIPSACAYVPRYTGTKPAVVVASKRDTLARSVAAELRHDAIALRAGLGKRYTWEELYDHRALVVVPYNVSVMSIFEHYTACAPVYVPTPEFLKELMAEHPTEVLSDLSFGQVVGAAVAPRPDVDVDLNDVRDPQVVDWFLERADFYDPQWMPHVRLFESWAHLDHLLGTDDHAAISARMAADAPERRARIAALWDRVDWFDRVGGA